MDAAELLANDHAAVKDLFSRYRGLDVEDRAEKAALFKRLRRELEVHATIEEELFYPAVREAAPATGGIVVREALEEHRLIRQILRDLERETPGSDEFDAKLNVLRENVLRHAGDEERDVFGEARASMTPAELGALAGRLADRKHELGMRVHRAVPVLAKARRAFARVHRAFSRRVRASGAHRSPRTSVGGGSRRG